MTAAILSSNCVLTNHAKRPQRWQAQVALPSRKACFTPRHHDSVACRALDLPSLAPADPESLQQHVYATLGLSLLSFVLTFGVAPRFKSSFKEADTWRDIYADFKRIGFVDSITPEEADARAQRGAVLLDVRLARKFENGAMQYSTNIPLYQPISGWSLAANIRRAGFAFFGIYGTERNMHWLSQAQATIPQQKEVILVCEMGGSLDAKTGAETGFQSRSLKAAYYLKKAGYNKVFHMKGGIDEYKRAVGPLVDVEELFNKGEPLIA